MSNNIKNPPSLNNYSSYETWEKALHFWTLVTDLKAEQRGPALVLTLTGKAQEAALELPQDDISKADGVKRILAKLAPIYKKDSVDTAYEAFEAFIYFKRDEEKSMNEFITEFERRLNKAKQHGCELSQSILGFFLLNQAQLTEENKRLVRATITKLEFEEVKTKLLKVFTCKNEENPSNFEAKVKVEDLNIAEVEDEEVMYGRPYYGSDKYYGRPNYGRARGFSQRPSRGSNFATRGNYTRGNYSRGQGDTNPNKRGSYRGRHPGAYTEGRYKKTRCDFCESICHQTYECPEKVYYNVEAEEEIEHDVILYQSELVTERDYNIFVAESSVAAILDCGATATVAGKEWFESYCDGLTKDEQTKIEYYDSNSAFKFGCGEKYKSLYKAKIPAKVGSKSVMIATDLVDTAIPLLLSKEAMKKAETQINFVDDTVKMFGQVQDVQLTSSGHYAIPLNNARNVLEDVQKRNVKITLIVNEQTENKAKVAWKLHAQFAHPPKQRLIKLLTRAGRGSDTELMDAVEEVYKKCEICKAYSKPTPRPVVGMQHATKFNEMIALDLKFFKGKIILHVVDHLTRFSSAIVCKSKDPKEIISGLVKCWISIFGPPQKILTDNGGEFANKRFLDLAESLNVRVLCTAGESPWSNGLVERHNATLSEMLHRVTAENAMEFETALAWALQAKNSLTNVHGFSPAQLAIGYTPQIPDVMNSKPPALEEKDAQDIVAENLSHMKTAREAYIKAESSERIKRALRHNIRPSGKNKFFSGDVVYYKRKDCRKWKGPGKVIGSDSSNILIKHGAHYVRVHVCRVMLDMEAEAGTNEQPKNDNDDENSTKEDEHSCSECSENNPEEQMHESESPNRDQYAEISPDLEVDQSDGNSQSITVKNKLRKGLQINFKTKDNHWHQGEVVRRTGKATGKYRDCWEIKDCCTDQVNEFDINKDWDCWNEVTGPDCEEVSNTFYCEEDHTIFKIDSSVEQQTENQINQSKAAEIRKWIDEGVFKEVKDQGQDRLSTTWVITSKVEGDETVTKARLVVRGYEEINSENRSDSPTCSRESVRMLLGIAMAKKWKVNSLDIKAAFLQGQTIERNLFVLPPKEFRKKDCIWKLNKVVYGLNDASRSWYLRMSEVLKDLGMIVTKLDKAVFTYRGQNLEGVIIVHVDDMLFFGSERFLSKVMDPFKRVFKISREETETFKYVGIKIDQTKDSIYLDQKDYLESMKTELLPKEAMKDKFRYVDAKEQLIFKRGVGQLGWLSGLSKPEMSFMFCALSTVQKNPQVADFSKYHKAVRELRSTQSFIKINKLELSELQLAVFSDASFGNLPGGASQLGYIIFCYDNSGNAIPLTWASKKAKRVARSTLTAETLAAVEAVDAACVLKNSLEEVLRKEIPPIQLFVDNKSLHDAAMTSDVIADKRLMIDM